MCNNPARIHPLVEQIDGRAFASTPNTGEIQHDREIALQSQSLLQGEQIFAQYPFAQLEFAFCNFLSQFGCLEHNICHSPVCLGY